MHFKYLSICVYNVLMTQRKNRISILYHVHFYHINLTVSCLIALCCFIKSIDTTNHIGDNILKKLTDSPHLIPMALAIQPLSCMIDPIADHHTDAEILAGVVKVCPQTDGEPLEGRFVGILHPVLDTGPLFSGLQHCQPATKQSRINCLIKM